MILPLIVLFSLFVLSAMHLLPPVTGGGPGSEPLSCGEGLCGLLLLPLFWLLPQGCLPPLLSLQPGVLLFSLVAFILLALAGQGGLRRFAPLLLFVVLTAVYALYAFWRGIPGNPLQVGTFVAMPLWGIAAPLERAGLVLLSFSLVLVCALLSRQEFLPRGSGRLWLMALSGLCVCLVFPWNPFSAYASSPLVMALSDFLFFWLKLFAFFFLLRFMSRRGKPQFGRWALGLAFAGTCLLLHTVFPFLAKL